MQYDFKVSVATEKQSGRILAVYFQVRKGKAAEVREFANGAAFANYNRKGELLGIEMLGPCKLAVLDKIAASEPENTRKFFRDAVPRKMVMAAG